MTEIIRPFLFLQPESQADIYGVKLDAGFRSFPFRIGIPFQSQKEIDMPYIGY
jgi:hypothetical protein